MEADGGETRKREGRPDRRNQLDLSADMMWSLRQGDRAVTLSEEQNRGPESQHWEDRGKWISVSLRLAWYT